jgi:crossover junction endodeoxyribonuclease RuvC
LTPATLARSSRRCVAHERRNHPPLHPVRFALPRRVLENTLHRLLALAAHRVAHQRGPPRIEGHAVSRLILGVDPGLAGAIALLGPAGELEHLVDLPVIRDGRLSWIDGAALQALLIETLHGRTARAIVERASAMPLQGIASAFNFGVGFGSVLSILQARHLAIELVTATVWKRALGLGSDKAASLHKARLLYPAADLPLAKHDGRAEALLIAHYAMNRTRAAAA